VPRTRLEAPMVARTFATTCVLLSLASTSPAATWTESGDAGSLPSSAQVTAGNGPLTMIQGTLSSNADQDVYCIRVTDPTLFTASLQCVAFADNDVWLFGSTGLGVAHNDGCTGGQTHVGTPLVTTAGLYYLAVSPSGDDAMNGASPIWNPPSASGQRAPDGPGAPGPISGWSNAGVVSNFNNYRLQLAGAAFCDPATPTIAESWGRLKKIYR
jgi:hypothetical protein